MPPSPALPARPLARSLADDVRARSDAELAALVTARPDLARPAPSDLTALAARSATRASTQRAVDRLDLAHLRVLEAIVVLGPPAAGGPGGPGGSGGPGGPGGVAEALGTTPEEVRLLLEELWALALLWHGPLGPTPSRTVAEVLGAHVAGLGPQADELGGPHLRPEEIGRRVAQAPTRARAVLERLTWGPPVGIVPGVAGAAARPGPARPASPTVANEIGAGASSDDGPDWLVAHGLLVRLGDDQVILPKEVGLVLRGGRIHPEPGLRPPVVTGRAVEVAAVDLASGGAGGELLGLVDELLADWGQRPPRVLRSGGLSVRDLAAAARLLDVPTDRAAFVVETSREAGLIDDDGELEPHWAPTAAYDTWQTSPGGERWAAMASAWLRSVRASHLVGQRGRETGSVNALGPDAGWPPIRSLRRSVLDALSDVSGAAADPGAVSAVLRWRRPRRVPGSLCEVVAAVLREAEWLGVTGRGALSSPGAALLAGDEGQSGSPADVMARHLPDPVDHVLLQGDLTAIAPGPLVGELAETMRLVADVESRGGATVYRFGEASLRRTLDAGWTAERILEALSGASRTAVPQPLDYLVRDVARRHGRVRVSSGRAVVRSDDPAALDEMLASRELGALQLRRVAPTVLVSPVAADVVVDLLRRSGHAPVSETAGGVVRLPPVEARRAPARRRSEPRLVGTVDDEHARELVVGLREREERSRSERSRLGARSGPAIPANDPTTSVAILREAIADGHAVWLGYADGAGATRRMLFYPERLDGGRVSGNADGTARTLSVHRITGVVAD